MQAIDYRENSRLFFGFTKLKQIDKTKTRKKMDLLGDIAQLVRATES